MESHRMFKLDVANDSVSTWFSEENVIKADQPVREK